MSFEIDRDSAAQADNIHTLTDQEPEFDAGAHALEILDRLMPDLGRDVKSGCTSFADNGALLNDVRCILDLISAGSHGDAMAEDTVQNAAWLALRMVEVATGNYQDPKAWEIICAQLDADPGAAVVVDDDGAAATRVQLCDSRGDLLQSWIVRHETARALRNRE